jgi:hypothetical protein
MRRSVLRVYGFRTVDGAPMITRYRMLNKHSISWMTLSLEGQLEAQFWCPVC